MQTHEISYWIDCINKDRYPEHAEKITRILNNELRFGRIVGTNIYKTPTIKADRFAWTTIPLAGKPFMYILDPIENHDYANYKYKDPTVLNAHLTKQKPLLEEKLAAQSALDEPEIIPVKFEKRALYYKNKFILPNQTQKNVLEGQTPVFIHGTAGSGKSSTLFETLHHMLATQPADNDGYIVYVAESERLVRDLERMWGEPNPNNPKADRVIFKSYAALFEANCYLAENQVHKHDFISWLETYLLDQRKWYKLNPSESFWFDEYISKTTPTAYTKHSEKYQQAESLAKNDVYQEFKLISIYATNEGNFNQQGYLALGAKQSLFSKYNDFDYKPQLFELYETYQKFCNQNNQWNAAFCSLNSSLNIYGIAADEGFDYSLLQWSCLLKLTTNLYGAGDSHQRSERRSYLPSILNIFQQYIVIPQTVQIITLPSNYRCPRSVIELANRLLAFLNIISGGVADEYDYTEIPILSEMETGQVTWLNPAEDSFCHIELEPIYAVVTLPEHLEEAKERYKTNLIFTPEEIKGLEFKNIITYRLFDDKQKLAAKASEHYDKLADKDRFLHKNQPLKNERNDQFTPALNDFFIAITRATENLYIVQNHLHKLKPLLNVLNPSNTKPTSLPTPFIPLVKPSIEDTKQWHDKLNELILHGADRQARNIFKTLHAHDTAMNYETYKENLLRPNRLVILSPKKTAKHSKSSTPSPISIAERVDIPSPIEKPVISKIASDAMTCVEPLPVEKISFIKLMSHFNEDNLTLWFEQSNAISNLIKFDEHNPTPPIIYIFQNQLPNTIFCNFLKKEENQTILQTIHQQLRLSGASTIWHIASYYNNLAFVELSSAYVDTIDTPNKYCQSPLYLAIKYGFFDMAKKLKELGAKPQHLFASPHNKRPFYSVVDSRSFVELKMPLLLDTPNAQLKSNTTNSNTLYEAARSGDLDGLKIALQTQHQLINKAIENNGMTPLIIAIKNKHKHIALELIKNDGILPDKKMKNGQTALMIAVQHGNKEIVDALITANATVNQQTKSGITALMFAVQQGDMDIITTLIKANAIIDQATENGSTALMFAIQHGDASIISLLLEHMASPNTLTQNGISPLLLAVQFGNYQVVQLLLHYGVNIEPTAWDKDQPNPFLLAVALNQHKIVEVFFQNGVKTTSIEKLPAFKNQSQLDALLHKYKEKESISASVLELFDTFKHQNSEKICKQLKKFFAQEKLITSLTHHYLYNKQNAELLYYILNNPDYACNFLLYLRNNSKEITKINQIMLRENHNTWVHIAARYGFDSLLSLLIEHGINIDNENREQRRPIHFAIKNNHLSTIKLLQQAGATFKNTTSNDALSPLFTAISANKNRSHQNVMSYLLKNGADENINATNPCPLTVAILNGELDCVKLLRVFNADLMYIDPGICGGAPPLYIAIQAGKKNIIEYLLNGINNEAVNISLPDGTTPLMLACKQGRLDIVELLIAANADVTCATIYGETAYSLAKNHGYEEICKRLSEKAAHIIQMLTIDADKTDSASLPKTSRISTLYGTFSKIPFFNSLPPPITAPVLLEDHKTKGCSEKNKTDFEEDSSHISTSTPF